MPVCSDSTSTSIYNLQLEILFKLFNYVKPQTLACSRNEGVEERPTADIGVLCVPTMPVTLLHTSGDAVAVVDQIAASRLPALDTTDVDHGSAKNEEHGHISAK